MPPPTAQQFSRFHRQISSTALEFQKGFHSILALQGFNHGMVGFVLSPIVVGKIIQPFSRNLTGEQTGMHGTVGQNSGSPRGDQGRTFFRFHGPTCCTWVGWRLRGQCPPIFRVDQPNNCKPLPNAPSFSFKVLESLPRLRQILDGLGPMNLIKVNPIPTDSSKRTFHLITNRFRGDKSPRSLILHGQDSAFGCYNHLIAFPLPQGLSHCNLSLPETGMHEPYRSN